jgi:hypothetical protein
VSVYVNGVKNAVATMGVGQSFGDIALLRNQPRFDLRGGGVTRGGRRR